MAYHVIAGGCGSSNVCPTVISDETRQDFIVQGDPVTDIDGFTIPAGEAAVRIPRRVAEELARALTS